MKRERNEKATRGGVLMNILGGSFLTREDFSKIFPFLVYVTVLLMLLITNAYIAESTSRAIKNNSVRLRDLRVEYTYAKSAFTKESTQKVLIDKLHDEGLKESLETRTVIVKNTEERSQKEE